MDQEIRFRELNGLPETEMAERKGKGHPDTLCDHMAEAVSVALSGYYLSEFGIILHHNVDKALLVGGSSLPAFGGGQITAPMELYLAGRATAEADGKKIPVEDIAVQTASAWLKKHMRIPGVENNVRIVSRIRPGSSDLTGLFKRFGKGETPLANDTSFGAGYWPLSPLENRVLQMEQLLNAPAVKALYPFAGEDIKVMGTRSGSRENYTVAVAMTDRYLTDTDAYFTAKDTLSHLLAGRFSLDAGQIVVNAADDRDSGNLYLTVSGCSAECGDDGQVGRGNRVNGLITPMRSMSLEASAGKNPINHVGKLYNLFATELSREICQRGLASEASVTLVSAIGSPLTRPRLMEIGLNAGADRDAAGKLAEEMLQTIPQLWKKILAAETPFELFCPPFTY